MKRTLSLALAALILLALCGCGESYGSYTLEPNEYLLGEDGSEPASPDGGSGSDGGYNTAVQLTADDIRAMNDGHSYMAFDDEGYLTFLKGRFSDDRVENYEDAIASLDGVASLIGMSAGSEFFAVFYSKDDDGYTYYTFQQRYGDVTVEYATLRVVVDPDGYTAGLASSFSPNLGIVDPEVTIGADEADEVVRQRYAEFDLTFYPDCTDRVCVTLDDVAYHAYAVYTNNPNSTAGDFGMAYIKHFVSVGGEYLYNLPVTSLSTDNLDQFHAEDYFDGLEQFTLTGEVTTWNGATEEIEVPVAYNATTGLYYLADLSRKIMVADFHSIMYQGILSFLTSETGTDFDNAALLAYDRYIKVYDFYAAQGVFSIDACGLPILICTGYCDANGTPVNNAGYCGINLGWATFGVSDINTYSEALDVVGHEYTHGVTTYSAAGNLYANASGAINEAYSDIMGNLCEMISGYTSDTEWLCGENCGEVFRSMSSPHDYGQPISLSDSYYQGPTDAPSSENDRGGVHQNSSLLAQMAYKLYEGGMSLDEERSFWVTTIEMLTPLADYDQVYGAMLMSRMINGFSESYDELITEAFIRAELIDETEAMA